jgi:hypothetical protein
MILVQMQMDNYPIFSWVLTVSAHMYPEYWAKKHTKRQWYYPEIDVPI